MASSDETSTYICKTCGRSFTGLTRMWRHTERHHPSEIRRVLAPGEISVGMRLRSAYPNASWGEGEVVDFDADRRGTNPDTGRTHRQKPIKMRNVVTGRIGWFHLAQVELPEEVAAMREP